MKLKIEEVKNLIKMLSSEDSSNHEIAFEILNKLNFETNLGELLIIYKESKLQKYKFKKLYSFFEEKFEEFNQYPEYFIDYSSLLMFLKKYKCSKNSFRLYEYFFEKYIKDLLITTGYSFTIKDFDIHFKLKNYE